MISKLIIPNNIILFEDDEYDRYMECVKLGIVTPIKLNLSKILLLKNKKMDQYLTL
jgi:hypothetical protein